MIQSDLDFGSGAVLAAYGGGVDSTAMLIEMVRRGERVDHALFADVGAEKPQTYEFIELFRDWLAEHGIPLTTVRYQPKHFKDYSPYQGLYENCLTNSTLPSIAFGWHSCSQKWKIAAQDSWTKEWQPAIDSWAAGKKVTKLIGYDAGPQDSRRYAHREGHVSEKYDYRYPLREFAIDREGCLEIIEKAGLPKPMKSACFFCSASKVNEISDLEPVLLRRIVLMEARAAPRLKKIDGLWRKPIKGARGATPRPGSMTEYIREEGLLPAGEIKAIVEEAPRALISFQETEAEKPLDERTPMSEWLDLFDSWAQRLSAGGGAPLRMPQNAPA